MIRSAISMIAAFAGMVLVLQDAPRVLFDFQHADEFVPAEGVAITDAQCTNWNIGIFDHCEVEFESHDGQRSGQLDDWRFGSAPTGFVQLMQWQEDSTVLTTDVSLAGVTNRLSFIVAVVLLGLLGIYGIYKKAMGRIIS